MSHVMRMGVVSAATLAALLLSRNIAAETVVEATSIPMTTNVEQSGQAGSPAVAQKINLMGIKPLDSKILATKRGAADVYNDMLLKGVVADNRAVNVATGNNLITEGAFSGAAGVPMVVQNSGNNVLIQNATILNIQVK